MLHGTIYHSDGGRTFNEFQVKLECDGTTHVGTVKNGKFKLQSKLAHWPKRFRLYVGSSMVPEKAVIRTREGAVIVLPSHYGKSNNLDAGVITGTVIQGGDGMPDCRIQAAVKGTKLLSFLGSPMAETWTGKKGRFALQVEGGFQVQSITVDGKEPASISLRSVQGEDERVSSRLIRIGTFRLIVERRPGILGF